MLSKDLRTKIRTTKAIVVDSCVLKSPYSAELLSYLDTHHSVYKTPVLFVYEDRLPSSYLEQAKKYFDPKLFVRADFVQVLEMFKAKECTFLFSTEISTFKEQLFDKAVSQYHFPFHKLNLVSSGHDVILSDGEEEIIIQQNQERQIVDNSNNEPVETTNRLYHTPSYKEKVLPQLVVADFPSYRQLFGADGSGLTKKSFQTRNHGTIELDREFSKNGGESIVFSAFGMGVRKTPMVAKLFRPEKLTTNKRNVLLRMLEKPIDDPQIAWPLDVILYQGEIIGYIRKDFGNSSLLEYITFLEKTRHGKLKAVEAAMKVCEIVAKVHALGLLIGDLKPENFLLMKKPDGSFDLETLSIIDTDSFQIDEYPMPMITPPYASPLIEILKKVTAQEITYLPVEIDGFALAVLLLKIFLGFWADPYLIQQGIDNDEYYAEYRNLTLKHIFSKSEDELFLFSATSEAKTELKIRNIFMLACWAHLPSPVKNAFAISFNDFKHPLTAEEWYLLMQKYSLELRNGSLRAIDARCDDFRFPDANSTGSTARLLYKVVSVNWGLAFATEDKRIKTTRTQQQLKAFKPSTCCSRSISDLLVDLSTASGLSISEQERNDVTKSLKEDGSATFDLFNIKLLVDIGIACQGVIERRQR